MKRIFGLAALITGLATGSAQAEEDVMIVFDASNSMWGQIDGEAKISIARDAMDRLLGDWTEGTNLGLMAYGHRRAGDCGDIETLVDPAQGTRDEIRRRIGVITPRGKTPLTASVEQAAEALSYRDNPSTVVLISDGIESCDRDPCALADTLAKTGVDFTAHVVGFALDEGADSASLACIAENTGGRFVAATDAAELGTALSEVSEAVAADAAETPPEPVTVELDAPKSTQAGADFDVSWSRTPDPADRIVMVPAGGAIDAAVASTQAGEATSATLTAPAQSGQYDLHYILADSGDVAGSDSMVVSGLDIEVSAPESAPAGATVEINWSESLHDRDYVTIVPADAKEGEHWEYDRVKKNTATTLTLPGDPGLYEARYVQNADGKTLGAATIEATEPKVSISGPETAETGSHVTVEWSKGINGRDYVTIVPTGADEGTHTGYKRVKDNSSATLTAPADPGLYEMRYVLNAGGHTIASAPLEVTEPQVTVSGPETATTGSRITVEWSQNINGRDYVTIVPAGAKEGEHMDYKRVSDNASAALTVPADPGLYELRYVLDAGKKTLASAPLEVTEPQVTVSGPETATTGSRITVEWSQNINGRDYVTIVPVGAKEGEHMDYKRVSDNASAALTVPAAPGLYELRYVLDAGKKTLASASIEVTEPEVGITAPDTIRMGDPLEVSWEGDVPNGRDYVTVVPAGAPDGKHGDYARVGDNRSARLDTPEAPGLYEVRYVLEAGKRVLARAQVEVVSKDTTLSQGGTLDAPTTGAPGASVDVGWSVSAPNGRQRVSLARSNQAAFTWIEAQPASEEPVLSFTLPDEPGFYEFRLLDLAEQEVLSRARIEVR